MNELLFIVVAALAGAMQHDNERVFVTLSGVVIFGVKYSVGQYFPGASCERLFLVCFVLGKGVERQKQGK